MKVTFRRDGFKDEFVCPVHRELYQVSPTDQHSSMAQRALQSYRYHAWFYDEAGAPVCDRCVTEGLLEGTVEVLNPDALRARPRLPRGVPAELVVSREAPGIMAAREALDQWGSIPLAVLERALEAAERHGRLAEIADRIAAAREGR